MTATAGSLTNWAGNVAFRAARLYRPATLDELRRVVAASSWIRALGSAHSFGLVADTTGDLVRLDQVPSVIEVDQDRGSVTVGAGTSYAELARHLDRAGLALANLASLPHISVAGSCATCTHGSGWTQRCLATAVRAFQLVGPTGELVELSRERDPDVFPGAVVALGALGIVTQLTLDVEPAYEMAQRVRVAVPLDAIVERVDAVFAAAYSVSMFTDWRSGLASVWLKRRRRPAPTRRPRTAGGRATRATTPVPAARLPAPRTRGAPPRAGGATAVASTRVRAR